MIRGRGGGRGRRAPLALRRPAAGSPGSPGPTAALPRQQARGADDSTRPDPLGDRGTQRVHDPSIEGVSGSRGRRRAAVGRTPAPSPKRHPCASRGPTPSRPRVPPHVQGPALLGRWPRAPASGRCSVSIRWRRSPHIPRAQLDSWVSKGDAHEALGPRPWCTRGPAPRAPQGPDSVWQPGGGDFRAGSEMISRRWARGRAEGCPARPAAEAAAKGTLWP